MFQLSLILRNHFQKKHLNSKADLISKPIETASLVGSLLAFFFKLFILCFFGIIILFPFYFMIVQAFSGDTISKTTDIVLYPHDVGDTGLVLYWSNFRRVAEQGGSYGSALGFTVVITAISVVCRMFFAMTFGYAFSIKKWRFKSFSWGFFLALLVLPETALLVGQWKVITQTDYKNNIILSLTMPFVASIFSGFMFRNAFEAIPDSVKESAMIDGTSELKFLVRVAIPMIKSTTWTVCILTALASWNSFLWPQLVLSSSSTTDDTKNVMNTWLMTVGQSDDPDDHQVLRNLKMAGSILVILPMFVTYFLFRGRIMRAISRQGSAQKG